MLESRLLKNSIQKGKMALKEDTTDITFCNKTRKFIPNFGKSHTNKTNKIKMPKIIKAVFDCLNLFRSELVPL